MTTPTLMEADRYLVNAGFVCTNETALGEGFHASYTFGNPLVKPARFIALALHDYGDKTWDHSNIGFSEGLADKAREVEETLRRLQGFRSHANRI